MPVSQRQPSDQVDRAEQRQSQQGCRKNSGEDQVGPADPLGFDYNDAQAGIFIEQPGDEFADDRADDRKPRSDPQAGEDVR